ncbi:MAG TPA: sensor histidine kinase [Bryobacteraceae bacterium]|nr:sensor histidine kinase [Bryobacteraceae bacterium]
MPAAATNTVPAGWRRIRSILRAALAVAALYAQIASPPSIISPTTIVAALFLIYALLSAVWKKLDELQNSIASLVLETAFFVAFAAFGADWNGWVGSSLFLYLMIAAAIGHDWWDVIVVAGASLAFFLVIQPPVDPDMLRVVSVAGILAASVGYHKRHIQTRVAASGRREKQLRAELDTVRELERQRIAGDFHDGPLQHFIALQVRLDILGTLLKRDRSAAEEDLKELQQISRQQVTEIRSFLRSMKPVEMDANDLVASTRRLVEYFQKDTGINSRFMSTEPTLNVTTELGQELIQILREALTNVQKHSRAERVVISLEQNGRVLELTVDDDGAGFAFSGSFNLDELDLLRLGPQSIKRRVRSIGGELQIESRPGHGAGLNIRVPC